MNNGSLESALPIIVSALGNQLGVPVHIMGEQACTNGEEVFIPPVDPTVENRKNVMVGYTAHEAAHIRFTDFDYLNSVAELLQGLTGHLENIIEDIRIEILLARKFPGTRIRISEAVKHLVNTGRMNVPTPDAMPAELLTGYMLFYLRETVLGMDFLEANTIATEQLFRAAFPKAIPIRLKGLMAKVPHLASTEEVVALALEIRKMVEDELEKERERQQSEQRNGQEGSDDQQNGQGQSGNDQNQDQNGNEQGSNGAGSDDGGSDQNQQNGEQGSDDDDQSTQNANSGSQDSDDQQQGQGDQTSSDQSSASTSQSQDGDGAGDDYAKVLEDTLTGDGVSEKDLGKLLSAVISQDVAENPDEKMEIDHIPSPCDGKSNESKGMAHFKRSQRISSPLRNRLEGLVQAERTEQRSISRKGKKVATRRICRVLGGDVRIFNQRNTYDAPNTAVHLLLDRSGSMKSNQMTTALESCLALLQSLEGIEGVCTSATAFPYQDQRGLPGVEVLKKTSENVRKAAKRFGIEATGGTPLAEAMFQSAIELSQSNSERRILFVLTDGAPNSGDKVRSVIDRLKKSGIEIIAIGIQHNSVEKYFENNVVIDEPSDLLSTMFELTRKLLVAA